MIKYIISHIFYYLGDFSSKILNLKCFRNVEESRILQWLADFYSWNMHISIKFDPDGKVWKFVEKDDENA